MKKLQGLIAAAHTPFNADGSVNLALVKKQAETLLKQKVTGVYISGTSKNDLNNTFIHVILKTKNPNLVKKR